MTHIIKVKLSTEGHVLMEDPDLLVRRNGAALHKIVCQRYGRRPFSFHACEFEDANAPFTILQITDDEIVAMNWIRELGGDTEQYRYWLTVTDADGFRHTSLGPWAMYEQEGGKGVIRNKD